MGVGCVYSYMALFASAHSVWMYTNEEEEEKVSNSPPREEKRRHRKKKKLFFTVGEQRKWEKIRLTMSRSLQAENRGRHIGFPRIDGTRYLSRPFFVVCLSASLIFYFFPDSLRCTSPMQFSSSYSMCTRYLYVLFHHSCNKLYGTVPHT